MKETWLIAKKVASPNPSQHYFLHATYIDHLFSTNEDRSYIVLNVLNNTKNVTKNRSSRNMTGRDDEYYN